MADGFIVKEIIAATPVQVWDYLTDFRNAKEWMTGVEDMTGRRVPWVRTAVHEARHAPCLER